MNTVHVVVAYYYDHSSASVLGVFDDPGTAQRFVDVINATSPGMALKIIPSVVNDPAPANIW